MSDFTNPYKAPASTEEAVSNGPVSAKTRDYLGQAAPWLRFLTILGYIGMGLGVAAAVTFIVVGILTPTNSQMAAMITTSITFLLVLAIFFFPLLLLGRLAKGSRQYKLRGEAADLEKVAKSVKGLAQYYGIFTIVILSIYLVAGIALVVFAGNFFGSL